jgi:DNA-binding SARP family transcriptional activator
VDKPIEFRVLGPLDVRVGGEPVRITAHRESVIMSALLFHPNTVLSTDQLVDAVWDGPLPVNPANQIAICVLALRRKLAEAGASPDVVETRAPGYLVRVGPGELDTQRVDALLERAQEAEDMGLPERTLVHLRAALGVWRGPVLTGTRSRWLTSRVLRWEELRVTLSERCIQRELELGHHDQVIGELSAMVADQWLRERPREQLMIALYRAGRSAQALSVYQVTRRMFLDELGIEPGKHMREVHDAILDGTLSMTPEVGGR